MRFIIWGLKVIPLNYVHFMDVVILVFLDVNGFIITWIFLYHIVIYSGYNNNLPLPHPLPFYWINYLANKGDLCYNLNWREFFPVIISTHILYPFICFCCTIIVFLFYPCQFHTLSVHSVFLSHNKTIINCSLKLIKWIIW